MRSYDAFSAALFFVAILSASIPSQAAAGRLITFEDLRRVVTVRSPRISPDGKQIVYVRSTIDWNADRNRSELVLVKVDGSSSRVLTHGRNGVDNPQWAPDGSAIALLASPETGKPPQLYVMPMNGGDALQITDAKSGVQSYAWRPSGKQLAFVSDDEAPNQKDIDKHLDAVVITDNDYLTREAPQPAHLWLVDASGGRATRLTSGSWSVVKGSAPVWSPDGTKLYYQGQPDPIFASFRSQTTYSYDFASKASSDLGFGVDSDPKISPDGSMIAVTSPRHGSLYLQTDLSVRSLASGHEIYNSRNGIDRNVHSYDWDGSDLIVGTTNAVRSILWHTSVASAATSSRAALGDVDFSDPNAGKDGAIAFIGLRRDHPGELYYLASGSSTPRQLTNENAWISEFAIARSEPFEWTTDLGTKADGVLTYPVHYIAGRKYPLILDIHGGPVSTSTWDLSGLEGLQLVQVLAARDYFVFRPNYRGSDNMGDAFLQAIVGDVASGPGRDNLAAVAALRATGMIDENRIGVSGWSGGGLQTSWLIGHANFWRAAVMGAAVTDWYQQALLADINENFVQTFFNGVLPFSKSGKAAYAAESPITYVDNVKTPTLILSDTRDQRVPVSQAYTFYHALRDRHAQVKFMAFPRAGHFPSDPVGREIVLRAWAGWFDRWMK
ncbi:MAG TPA: S9 family peptidase [Candidatus Rubrimentiphilum sp.]|nr:S9 family peptidase [Candidatus Rubrimentiphilum sp.]